MEAQSLLSRCSLFLDSVTAVLTLSSSGSCGSSSWGVHTSGAMACAHSHTLHLTCLLRNSSQRALQLPLSLCTVLVECRLLQHMQCLDGGTQQIPATAPRSSHSSGAPAAQLPLQLIVTQHALSLTFPPSAATAAGASSIKEPEPMFVLPSGESVACYGSIPLHRGLSPIALLTITGAVSVVLRLPSLGQGHTTDWPHDGLPHSITREAVLRVGSFNVDIMNCSTPHQR